MPSHGAWAKRLSSTLHSSSSIRTTLASLWLTGCSQCGTTPTLPSLNVSEHLATSSKTDGDGRGSCDRCLLQRVYGDLSWPYDAPWRFSTNPIMLFYPFLLASSQLIIHSILFPFKFCFLNKTKSYQHKSALKH